MADQPLIAVTGLMKSFGGLIAVDDLALDVFPNEVHAVIGPNGAGKTTLISQLSGELGTDAGVIRFRNADITDRPAHIRARLGIARSYQITSIFPDMSVIDNVTLAVQARFGQSYFHLWRPARGDPALVEPAMRALAVVGLDARSDHIAGDMSHGEHRQLEIAMALATEPTLLLLDEPLAGMGPEESGRMIETIRRLKDGHAILLIEHDMDAVFALADRITVMVFGRAIRTGTPEEIRADEAVRRAYLGDEGVSNA